MKTLNLMTINTTNTKVILWYTENVVMRKCCNDEVMFHHWCDCIYSLFWLLQVADTTCQASEFMCMYILFSLCEGVNLLTVLQLFVTNMFFVMYFIIIWVLLHLSSWLLVHLMAQCTGLVKSSRRTCTCNLTNSSESQQCRQLQS